MNNVKSLTKTQVNNMMKKIKATSEDMNTLYLRGLLDGLRWCHDRIEPITLQEKC